MQWLGFYLRVWFPPLELCVCVCVCMAIVSQTNCRKKPEPVKHTMHIRNAAKNFKKVR